MSEKEEQVENITFIGHESQQVVPKPRRCTSKIKYAIASICMFTFVSSSMTVLFFCDLSKPYNLTQPVCHAFAYMENVQTSVWIWNNESCNGEMSGYPSEVKINRKGLYTVHVQVGFRVKDDEEPEKFTIRLKLEPEKPDGIITSYMPMEKNIPPDNKPATIVCSLLLEKEDIIKLEINFNESKITDDDQPSTSSVVKKTKEDCAKEE
ncbi:uncharacterized protein O3C94_016523 [Discoglossus pictus]